MGDFNAERFRSDLIQIESNDPDYKRLKIHDAFIRPTDEFWEQIDIDWGRLGKALGHNTNLKELGITIWKFSWNVPVESMEEFFRGLINNRSIERLIFRKTLSCVETDEVLRLFEMFLVNNKNLKIVKIFGSSPRHCRVVRSIVRSCTSLQHITLHECELESIEQRHQLFSLLGELPDLETVHWKMGWRDAMLATSFIPNLVELLQNQQSSLRELRLHSFENISNTIIGRLAQGIANNNKLKSLELGFPSDEFFVVDWEPFKKVIRFSNHTLERFRLVIGDAAANISDEVQSLLQMNCSDDKQGISFRKSVDYGFLAPEREFGVAPLENGFETVHLPYLLASIGTKRSNRDHRSPNYRLAALYHLIKNEPLLIIESGTGQVRGGESTIAVTDTALEKVTDPATKEGGNETWGSLVVNNRTAIVFALLSIGLILAAKRR